MKAPKAWGVFGIAIIPMVKGKDGVWRVPERCMTVVTRDRWFVEAQKAKHHAK